MATVDTPDIPTAKRTAEALAPLTDKPHTLFEDTQAIFTGTLFVSLALILFAQVGLITGGTAGAAFVLSHLTGYSFGKWFFVVNLPFYGFSWKRMGPEFTLKTFVAVTALSLMTEYSPRLFAIERLHPGYAAVLGGLLLGSGCLFLARHRASLGGATIVSLYFQQVKGWRAGKVQMAIDISVLLIAALILPRDRAIYSVLGAVVMSSFIYINHRPGRYTGS
ncbi:YitT family protein [Ideonella azotifigens]|uniref:YitT family protein n=1 Tax=Ideonella azotifigens TaxID=513160 RepID=A0ABN1KEC9_9BURK|nr:YitT family protein [Ideonella azotifigens]MCD2340748.1 YitT family protein [Ideonella azotifigens]